MAVTICPWCQSEIPTEEGQEPEKFCPVCDNEMDGYRTMRLDIVDNEEEVDNDSFEDDEDEDAVSFDEEEWDESLVLKDSAHDDLLLEEVVERLLDEQELVPECPNCREYMLETGELLITPEQFRPNVPQSLGVAVMKGPFALTMYVCPSCFTTQTQLTESGREQMMSQLSKANDESGRQG